MSPEGRPRTLSCGDTVGYAVDDQVWDQVRPSNLQPASLLERLV